MAGKKATGENSKKAAGNAKKAEVAAQKAAAENAKKAEAEDQEWGKGAKNNAKKEAEAAKKAEQTRKKAEKDALLAEEEKELKTARAAPKNAKVAVKKTKSGAKEQKTTQRSELHLSPSRHISEATTPYYTSRLTFARNREAEAAKKAEQTRKKAEKDALLAEEEKELKTARAAPKNAKVAVKKTKGLDLSQLDDDFPSSSAGAPALNATGIDNALDALSLTNDSVTKVDKHPERRFKAAFAAFEERRLKEMDQDGSGQGLRQNQKREKIRKEFEKSEENPFNQVRAAYDASKEEIKELREAEKAKIEQRLGK